MLCVGDLRAFGFGVFKFFLFVLIFGLLRSCCYEDGSLVGVVAAGVEE